MAFNLTTPVTGGPQTGFTAPTHSLTADTPPANNAKQWTVSSLGGTQTGASVHSVSSPFTISVWRPMSFKTLGKANPVTGLIPNVQNNVYKVIVRKGVVPLAGQPTKISQLSLLQEIPAGSDLASPGELRSAFSLMTGSVWQQSAGLGDTVVSGTI
jgi:hypothetical protein